MKRLLPLLFMFFLSGPAFAEDEVVQEAAKLGSMTYAPEYCEFSATFPADAYKSRRCEDKERKSCYDLVSFTKVFELSATVRVDIICNPSTPEMYEQLTTEAMETTVKAMTKDTIVEAYDISSRQDETYRHAGLLGKGSSGVHDTIYIAQLWSGKKSMMSVEAELIGEPIEAADEMFAAILRSIGPIPTKTDGEQTSQDDQSVISEEKSP